MTRTLARLAAMSAGVATAVILTLACAPGEPTIHEEHTPTATATDTTIHEVIHEDDPRWDCRTMGNQQCGVEIEGTWYLVHFEDGLPTTATVRATPQQEPQV